MLRTIRTNFDRDEARRDRRYPLRQICVSLDAGDYETANWSLGGFLLADGPDLALGATVAGNLKLFDDRAPFDFTAEVVRRDHDGVGFHFVEISSDLVGALDRVLANRMFKKRA
jgi:hypothetical protein